MPYLQMLYNHIMQFVRLQISNQYQLTHPLAKMFYYNLLACNVDSM